MFDGRWVMGNIRRWMLDLAKKVQTGIVCGERKLFIILLSFQMLRPIDGLLTTVHSVFPPFSGCSGTGFGE